MAEARSVRDAGIERVLVDGTVGGYEVRQLPTGKAGYRDASTGGISGDYLDFRSDGQATIEKTTGMVLLKGGRVYWDHSANKAHYKKVNDRDFYLGRVAETATSSALTVVVDLNADPPYDLDIARDPVATVIVGTQGLNTMGVFRRGGAHKMILSTTNEAQKMDLLSVDGFDTAANAIVEFAFRVVSDGAGAAPDFNIGVANGTHATDADSITESILIHLDGNAVDILAESDDGTVEVAATDTTINYTEGSAVAQRVEGWIDMSDPASAKIYINGSQVLSGTTFNVSVAAGPWFLLAHLEKSAAADVYEIDVDWLRVRYAEQ